MASKAALVAAALTVELYLAFAFGLGPGCTRTALAAPPGCAIGNLCRDEDGDGFRACGCAGLTGPCDCDDLDPKAFPGAPEACNASKDLRCDGARDGGSACDAGTACLDGICAPLCIPLDDFGCAPRSDFFRVGERCVCKQQDCKVFGCPPGFTCDDTKTCVENCHPGVRCPAGQRCRGFGCVDPCAGITCEEGATCVDGLCVPSCACAADDSGCPPGSECDREASPPACVDPACKGVRCAACTHCERGTCVDDCEGVACPPNLVCRIGSPAGRSCAACVDLCSPNPCSGPDECDWRTGACIAPVLPEAGLAPVDPSEGPFLVEGGGFACSSSGLAQASMVTALGAAVFAAVLAARRRRR